MLAYQPSGRFDIVFAFPPCTDLANSGARWWAQKGDVALQRALKVVKACAAIGEEHAPVWMLENPVGRLSTHWRPFDYAFDPYEYGGYLDPHGDAYSKRTCLWTSPTFVMPPKKPVREFDPRYIHFMPPKVNGMDRRDVRSETPMGFARAVFEANRHGVARRRAEQVALAL